MNFRKIALDNERSTHVTKRLNRLNTWKFFRVLYRENVWRIFGFSLLMLLLLAPIFVMLFMGQMKVSNLEASLPLVGDPFTSGAWIGVEEVLAQKTFQLNLQTGLLTVAVSLVTSILLSGGFAVIRDSFWTGKLSTVGVFKSLWLGIKANFLYALVCEIVIAFGLFGLFTYGAWIVTAIPMWIAIITIVLLAILYTLIVTYLLILCSVTVTYKQSVGANLRDAWLLLWLNVLPNVIHLIFALLPIGLYLLTQGSFLQSIVMVVIFMFGGLYFPLVWHSHMMRTFALFHPVDTKKKKQKVENTQVGMELPAEEQSTQAPTEQQPAPKKSKKKKSATTPVEQEQPTDVVVDQQPTQTTPEQDAPVEQTTPTDGQAQ